MTEHAHIVDLSLFQRSSFVLLIPLLHLTAINQFPGKRGGRRSEVAGGGGREQMDGWMEREGAGREMKEEKAERGRLCMTE